jgi:hypothetical protein
MDFNRHLHGSSYSCLVVSIRGLDPVLFASIRGFLGGSLERRIMDGSKTLPMDFSIGTYNGPLIRVY